MFHKMICKNCNREWTTNLDINETHLKYCPGCSGFWEVSIEEEDHAISGEQTLGRFSSWVFLRNLHYFVRGCLLVAGTIAGVIIVLITAIISLLNDWIFKEKR